MKKKHDFRPFVGMHKEVIFSPEWARLSPRAKDLYWLLKGKRNPAKKLEVKFSYRELLKLKHRGLRTPKTIAKTFKELEVEGWIEKASRGGLFGQTQFYLLTGRLDQYGFSYTAKKGRS